MKLAVEEVSKGTTLCFTIDQGEWVELVGTVSSEKSAFLRQLAALENGANRCVCWDGNNPNRLSWNRLSEERRHFGMTFSKDALFDELSVIENVALGGIETPAHLSRCQLILEALGVGNVAHSLPNTLSFGMRKRVALARALVRQPDVVLLDNPLAGLDDDTARRVLDVILQTCTVGRTPRASLIFFSDKATLNLPAERFIALEGGRIRYDGQHRAYAIEATAAES